MKATMPSNYADIWTIGEVRQARRAIKALKDYDETPEGAAGIAARMISGDNSAVIIQATAEVEKNTNIEWDGLGDGTGIMDAVIRFTAYSPARDAIYQATANLYTIFQITGDRAEDEALTGDMYIRTYVRA